MFLDKTSSFWLEVLKIGWCFVLHESADFLLKRINCVDLLLLHDLLIDHVALGRRVSIESLRLKLFHHYDVFSIVFGFVG